MTEPTEKQFTTLQAQFALHGHTLTKTSNKDGTESFYAVRWGMSKHLPDPEAAHAFLKQIGGSHGV